MFLQQAASALTLGSLYALIAIRLAISFLILDMAVLNHGEPIAEGRPDVVRHDPAVIAAHLGEQA